ncbi:receptor-type tyrosine-protein phosphatase alpha-like isoform X2 [Ostrea edulis]|uniref:receptor-type tyrosine-protein phosphatase alpha-like isoform X2 n=1 Tax=Ostrea edulis TaxID=37623 RepID=UPI0024AF2123|nr:receptor-type tyrosine-protein phosphatase alpha-like isoform X2 [Ostrea edulis]XP_056019973.1 receptor-type tyrosine-protein phosphatase alpha-like isoform X2 [Ostrea edulis]
MEIYAILIFSTFQAQGVALRAEQSSVRLMGEASDAIDGDSETYALTNNQSKQYWRVIMDDVYNISLIFIRIRGASTNNMFYVYISGDERYSNETLCGEFSFSNTIINEKFIKCEQAMMGDTLTLRRDGEIRLFEFRPLTLNTGSVHDVISGKYVDCFENFPAPTSVTDVKFDNSSKLESSTTDSDCPICDTQIFPNICNSTKTMRLGYHPIGSTPISLHTERTEYFENPDHCVENSNSRCEICIETCTACIDNTELLNCTSCNSTVGGMICEKECDISCSRDKLWISILVCGTSFGVVMVIGLAISARLMLKKKYKNESNYDIIALEEIHQSMPELLNFEIQEEEVEYCNLMSYRQDIDTFIQEVARKKTYDKFIEEFQQLPNSMTDSYTEALKWTNMPKNRYRQNYPYDYARVVLDPDETSGKTDYINASYINGFDKERNYIAAQGPFSSDTLKDFWAMIWQNNCTRVVMLANVYEGDKISCLRYWPHSEDCIGPFYIKLDRQDVYRHYIIRQLSLSKQSDEQGRSMRISHFQYTSWHEKRVPECEDSILCFRNLVKSGISESDGPILVHCSAGIGRTGTFIALDYLLEESSGRRDLDVISCVSKLRQQRAFVIQTYDEYMFLHDVLVRYFAKHRMKIEDNLRSDYNPLNQ